MESEEEFDDAAVDFKHGFLYHCSNAEVHLIRDLISNRHRMNKGLWRVRAYLPKKVHSLKVANDNKPNLLG